eukprot:Skav223279  [mRNA]  locus=scaffold3424:268380:276140:+ [translate_table: standard]
MGVAGPQNSDHGCAEDMAWNYLAQGEKSSAQKCFAVSTSRINGDFVYFIYHHLRNRGYECLQAPYFAGAQLAHFAEQGVVQTIFGPPGLLLYGVKSVVIHLNFSQQSFDWVDLGALAELPCEVRAMPALAATREVPEPEHFPASAASWPGTVYIIKQAPLINWMQTFPTDDMRSDHVDGYCICKAMERRNGWGRGGMLLQPWDDVL